LGLGVAIARRLGELHGGRSTASGGGVGRGARFAIHLPVHEPPAGTSAVPPASSSGVLSGRNILVVEDDADSREALTMALELHGAHVRSAGSADEALSRVEDGYPDAILSDLSMPGTDRY